MESPGESSDLTVRIPIGVKGDNKPSKPVKLKRKSYDTGKSKNENLKEEKVYCLKI